MKTREFIKLQKKLIPQLCPDLVICGSFCFVTPLGDAIRGFYFDSSAFSTKHFYVTVFFLPLWVPVTRIHLTFGRRIGASERWNSDQADLETTLLHEMGKEMPFLLELKTPEKMVEALEPFALDSNPHCREALGYALIQAGMADRSAEMLQILLESLDVTVPWQEEIASRAKLITALLAHSIEAAQQHLVEWRLDSVIALDLKAFT